MPDRVALRMEDIMLFTNGTTSGLARGTLRAEGPERHVLEGGIVCSIKLQPLLYYFQKFF